MNPPGELRMEPHNEAERRGTTRAGSGAPVAQVEIDCYCQACGYNLHGQYVHRDPHTELLVSRCPECGRYHAAEHLTTAGGLWLRRLGTLALCLWMMLIVGAVIGLACALGGIMLGTLEELTTTHHDAMLPPALASLPAFMALPPGANITITRSGFGNREYQVRNDVQYFAEMAALITATTAGLGFVSAGLIVVTLFHWRRRYYWIAILLVPAAVGTIVFVGWRIEAPNLQLWGLGYIAALAGIHLLGGCLGCLLGRPLARGLLYVLLPPRARQVFAFLWLVDAKIPPDMPASSRAASAGQIR